MLTIALALFLAGPADEAPQPPWAQEPDAYRGIKWGADLATARPAMGAHGISCVCKADAGTRQRSGPCPPKPEAETSKTPGFRLCSIESTKVASVLATEAWVFSADKLGEVVLQFEPGAYDTLRDVLIEKYGSPTVLKKSDFKTVGGGVFENEHLVWSGRDVTVEISRYSGNASQGLATFGTNSFRAEQERQDDDKRRKAARDSF